jgi:two-component system response regulator ChvI
MRQAWINSNTDTPPFLGRRAAREPVRPERSSSAIQWAGTSPRVVLIHAEDSYCTALAACLRAQELFVIEFDDPRAALLYVTNGGGIDAVLIDADLPQASGIDLLVRFRSLGGLAPAAIVADDGEEEVEEVALEHGASDFLSKSRSPSIGAKRVRLLIGGRKFVPMTGRPLTQSVTVGELDLKLQSHRALWRKALVPLTVTEFKIVRLLVCRAGEEVSYREIYDVVHGAGFLAGDGQHGYRSNVRSLIRKIRNRFRAIDPDFLEIENYPGFGYRWREQSRSEGGQLVALSKVNGLSRTYRNNGGLSSSSPAPSS